MEGRRRVPRGAGSGRLPVPGEAGARCGVRVGVEADTRTAGAPRRRPRPARCGRAPGAEAGIAPASEDGPHRAGTAVRSGAGGHGATVQVAGSLVVVGAFAAAELSARALSAWPGSAWAWWLELELFRPFELARAEGSPLHPLFGPASLGLALALMPAIWLVRRRPLAVAAIANLCFVATLALVHGWLDGTGSLKAASLGAVFARPRVDLALVALMSAASLAGFVLSHASFARRIARERGG